MGRAARPRPPAPNAPRGSPTCSGFAAGAQEGTPCSSDPPGTTRAPQGGGSPSPRRRLPPPASRGASSPNPRSRKPSAPSQPSCPAGTGDREARREDELRDGVGGKAEAAAKSLLPPVPHHCHPPSWGQAGGRDGAAPELVPASPPGWPRPSRASSEALVRVLGQGHTDRRRI